MARYGQAFKDKAVARLLPPESASLEVVSREMGVSVGTLERWREDAQTRPARGRAWSAGARLEAVIAYFSDRGRLFQADRGRRIGVAVAALGKRAGTGVNVS